MQIACFYDIFSHLSCTNKLTFPFSFLILQETLGRLRDSEMFIAERWEIMFHVICFWAPLMKSCARCRFGATQVWMRSLGISSSRSDYLLEKTPGHARKKISWATRQIGDFFPPILLGFLDLDCLLFLKIILILKWRLYLKSSIVNKVEN